MVQTVCSRGALRHTPVRPTHPAIRGNRGHKENKRKQAEKQARWLKQVRKVKRIEKSEKWVTRPRGEERGVKKKFVQQKTKTIGGRVKGAKMGSKRLNHVC